MNAIDTNILLYSIDSTDLLKQERALNLFEKLVTSEVPTVLPWQVTNEFLANLRKRQNKGLITSVEVRERFEDIVAIFPVYMHGIDAISYYFSLLEKYNLSHWDAMLISACHTIGVTKLYSEDMGNNAVYGTVQVINPLL